MYFLGYVHLPLGLLLSVCLFEHVSVCVYVCVCVVSLFIILSFHVQNVN